MSEAWKTKLPISWPQVQRQRLSQWSQWDQDPDIFLTFTSHSTLGWKVCLWIDLCPWMCTFKGVKDHVHTCMFFPCISLIPWSWRRKIRTGPALSWGKICPSLLHFGPFSLFRPTSSQLVRKDESGDDSFLRASRASYSFIHCWMLWPLPLEQKDLRLRVHLMKRKQNRLVVIILDYTLESTLLGFLNSIGQTTYYTKSASISGGRKEENQKNSVLFCFF